MNQGWIKLHRQLLEHPRLAHPGWLHLWTTLLLLANHSGAGPRMIFQGQEITLQPGQLITSRDRLAERTGMNASKIERLLSLMQTEQQIEQVGGVRSRLITITNWAGWQTGEQVTEQLANSCRTATEHTQEGKNDQKGGELKCLNALTLSFINSWKDAENYLAAQLGEKGLGQWGGFWRTRFQENRDKFQRVWSEVEAQQKEGARIQSAGAYAHDLWKRFV
jgi:hypothetical protein